MANSAITIDSLGLMESLRLGKGDVVSLVGAGGKTTLLYLLSNEMRRHGLSVITTSTTHMQIPNLGMTIPPIVFADDEENWLTSVKEQLSRFGSVTVVGSRERDDKLKGIASVDVDPMCSLVDCVLIEADGARGRSLKAPETHEPVVPEQTTLTVVLAGLDVLGLRLEESAVHRLDRVLKASWATKGMTISEDIVADTLANGYLSSIPAESRRVAFLNKAEDSRLSSAEYIAENLIQKGFDEVVFGELARPQELFFRVRPDPNAEP